MPPALAPRQAQAHPDFPQLPDLFQDTSMIEFDKGRTQSFAKLIATCLA
jgi:hypothetical protein